MKLQVVLSQENDINTCVMSSAPEDSPNPNNNVLVVEDDLLTARVCQAYLKQGEYESRLATTGAEAIEQLSQGEYHFVILDLGLPDMNGFDIMEFLKPRIEAYDIAVIIVTGDTDLNRAAEAVKHGAYDFIVKPFDSMRFLTTLSNAQAMMQMRREMQHQKIAEGGIAAALGDHVSTKLAEKILLAASRYRSTVYIIGESKETKEVVARNIHDQSRRRDKPFVKVDCSNIPRTSIARELFGDVRSTIPGAIGRAEGGTLFLDMISVLPLSTQKMVVHFLTTNNYHRLGELSWRTGNCRLICATARDLREEMAEGTYFLGDFYFHLCSMPLFLPKTETVAADDIAKRAKEMLG